MKVISYPGVGVQENTIFFEVSFRSELPGWLGGRGEEINKGVRELGGPKHSQAGPPAAFLQVWSLDHQDQTKRVLA